MNLLLTYHRLCEPSYPESERDFYTIPRDVFCRQMECLSVNGLSPLDTAMIRTTLPAGAQRCFLCFDDGTADHYEIAFPVLEELGMRATFFVPTIKLDRPGHLTRGQIREMAAAGHIIGCHSHKHERIDELTAPEVAEQIDTSVQILADATGLAPWIFAPPGGFTNANVLAAATRAGLEVVRTMRWGFNHHPNLQALETIPLTRHTTEKQFRKILQGKSSPIQYAGKEAIKTILPTRAYEIFRATVFRLRRKRT